MEIKQILNDTIASEVDRDGKKVKVPANMGSGILRVDKAVLRVINDMRKAQDKNAVDLKIEDLLASTSIKLTVSGGPKEYTITAAVSAVGPGGTDITIETSGQGVLEGSKIQSISAPGKVSWKLTKESDGYFIKVFRSDTGGCALLTIGKVEINPNLIHGVVPTKVTAHGTSTNNLGKWDLNFEFWNVGKLGGEQYAKATFNEICTEPAGKWGVQDASFAWEGYFTGGPNGDMYLTMTWEGETYEIHFNLKDGKEVTGGGFSASTIDNPEAFDGWVD